MCANNAADTTFPQTADQLAESSRDAEHIRRASAQWDLLVRDVAVWFNGDSIQALGRQFVGQAKEHLDEAHRHAPGEPAPRTGLYFCARCIGRQDNETSLSSTLDVTEDRSAAYRPIFAVKGMIAPPCKRPYPVWSTIL